MAALLVDEMVEERAEKWVASWDFLWVVWKVEELVEKWVEM